MTKTTRGDVFDGGVVCEKLQRNDKYRFLGALACVSTAARVAVAVVAKPSNAEMEVQVAQAATMVTLGGRGARFRASFGRGI